MHADLANNDRAVINCIFTVQINWISKKKIICIHVSFSQLAVTS